MSELGIDKVTALDLLRKMLLIRRFEEACAEHYSAGSIRGFLHLYIGQEACAVGICDRMEDDEAAVATYREHGHALMRGLPAGAVMAEMFGKREGCSGGRGGSMHLFSADKRFYGGNAIVAGGLPLAVGLALGDKMRGVERATVCFFGEGAMAEGEFHESMNLAELWKLPVLFVCENNGYAMGTALERSESQTDLVRKAESYRVPAAEVDGMDVLAVRDAAEQALERVREPGWGPFFLECRTYRFRAHSMFDAELYREKKEVEVWKEKCPIETWTRRIRQDGLAEESDLHAIENLVRNEVDKAVAFAEAGTLEPVEELYRHVFWEGGAP